MHLSRWRLDREGGRLRLRPWSGDEPEAGELFQERLRETPFWMLVACSLVNLTTWRQARPALDWLMASYPTPEALSRAEPEDLHAALQPLGLWRRRAVTLTKLAARWLEVDPACVKIESLPGCGKYAADSWAIFVDGRTDVDPTDGKLTWYLQQLRKQTDG